MCNAYVEAETDEAEISSKVKSSLVTFLCLMVRACDRRMKILTVFTLDLCFQIHVIVRQLSLSSQNALT